MACGVLHAWLPRLHRAGPSTSLDKISLIGWYSISTHVTMAVEGCQAAGPLFTLKFPSQAALTGRRDEKRPVMAIRGMFGVCSPPLYAWA
jgi:hypothetical protein